MVSSTETLFPLLDAVPVVDLAPADDETARDLKNRLSSTADGAPAPTALARFRFSPAAAPAAGLVPSGRVSFSLRTHGPPRARTVDLRRMAWLA